MGRASCQSVRRMTDHCLETTQYLRQLEGDSGASELPGWHVRTMGEEVGRRTGRSAASGLVDPWCSPTILPLECEHEKLVAEQDLTPIDLRQCPLELLHPLGLPRVRREHVLAAGGTVPNRHG